MKLHFSFPRPKHNFDPALSYVTIQVVLIMKMIAWKWSPENVLLKMVSWNRSPEYGLLEKASPATCPPANCPPAPATCFPAPCFSSSNDVSRAVFVISSLLSRAFPRVQMLHLLILRKGIGNTFSWWKNFPVMSCHVMACHACRGWVIISCYTASLSFSRG